MPAVKLHLDADASRKDLLEALRSRGHDVTRTPTHGLPEDSPDEYQLLWSTAQGRVLFTHNIPDFIRLAGEYPNHGGIILASQTRYSLSQLIVLLDKALSRASAEEFVGRVREIASVAVLLRNDSPPAAEDGHKNDSGGSGAGLEIAAAAA